MAYFEQPAIVHRSGGQINVYYGGMFKPDGPGHGHVRVTGGPLGENIVYWRLPESEGGQVIVQRMGNHERQRLARSPH